MARGPKRKPTPQLLKEGSWRGQARAKTEPRLNTIGLTPPPWLSDDAREHFEEIAEQLRAASLDKDHFSLTVAGLAHWLSVFIQATRDMVDEPAVLISPTSGGRYINPALNVASAAWGRVQTLALECGMSPASLSKITGDTTDQPDELDQWLADCAKNKTQSNKRASVN